MKNMNNMTLLAAGTCAMIAASAANAAVVAGWSFTGLTGYGASPQAATSSDANVTVGGLTRGSGMVTSGTAASNAWGGTMAAARSTAAAAITASQFATFTVTAASGYAVSFTQIDSYHVRRSTTGPASGQWQYRIDSGSFSDIGSVQSFASDATGGNAMSAVGLSGISALQSVAAGSAVTFRMVMYANTSVPAPGAIALLGVAGLVGSRRRR
jgi:MYXO-CTERM domain-containing protein